MHVSLSFRIQERFFLLSILVLTPCHSSPVLERVKRFSYHQDKFTVTTSCFPICVFALRFSFDIVQDFCVCWITPLQLSTGINFATVLVIMKPVHLFYFENILFSLASTGFTSISSPMTLTFRLSHFLSKFLLLSN